MDSVDFTGSVWCLVGVGIFGSFVDHGNEVLRENCLTGSGWSKLPGNT